MKLENEFSSSASVFHVPSEIAPDLFPATGGASFDVIADIDVLVSRINTAHAEAKAYAGRAIDRALEAGELLLLAKQRIPHGQWQSWLMEHCPAIGPRQAQRYMKIAGDLPVEKRHESFLTINGALRMLIVDDPDRSPAAKEPRQEISFLPNTGETAYLIDDDWEYFIVQSSQHPGYYWLQRWFNDRAGNEEFDALYRHNEEMDSDYNVMLMRQWERRIIPCNIFRRPMNETGVNMMLRKWKVQDEPWTLLGPHECVGQVIEDMGLAEWERHKRETWPAPAATEVQS